MRRSIKPHEERVLEEFDQKMLKNYFSDTKWDENKKGEIQESILKKLPKSSSSHNHTFSPLKIAAAITLFISIGAMGYFILQSKQLEPEIEIVTATKWGERITIDLMDGTRVKLNSESSLRYPKKFTGRSREVILEGEAFFDVAPNPKQPFIIHTNELTTEVLGTSFNIQAYRDDENIEITVATGHVKVKSKTHEEIHLKKSDQAVFHKKSSSMSTRKIDKNLFPSWNDNIIKFDNVELGTAVIVLEKWFGVSIKIEEKAAEKCRFTGKFKDEKLTNILKSLAKLKNGLYPVMVSKDSVVIKGSCD